ncbi:hypothetical protein [Streptosporangium sp. OZ121]|uniref:hypothetical protein n=1 Tax=Streptosporangium sp. OZ121 TaxID=3444183 RepID=UPI003F79B935
MYANTLPTMRVAAQACREAAKNGVPTKALDTIVWFANASGVWNDETLDANRANVYDLGSHTYYNLCQMHTVNTGSSPYPDESDTFDDITEEDLPTFITSVLNWFDANDDADEATPPAGAPPEVPNGFKMAEHLLAVMRLANASDIPGLPNQTGRRETDGVYGHTHEALIRLLRVIGWPREMAVEAILHAINEGCTMSAALFACQTGR